MIRDDEALYPRVDPIKAGLKGCCPRCGRGKLFDGLLKVKQKCSACGLDYSFADAGDGPAVFVMMIAGFLIIGMALWFDSAFHPPVWLHALIWIPVAVIISLVLLRKMKGIMITLQYSNDASEGRIDRD